jgi:hypothetical protein
MPLRLRRPPRLLSVSCSARSLSGLDLRPSQRENGFVSRPFSPLSSSVGQKRFTNQLICRNHENSAGDLNRGRKSPLSIDHSRSGQWQCGSRRGPVDLLLDLLIRAPLLPRLQPRLVYRNRREYGEHRAKAQNSARTEHPPLFGTRLPSNRHLTLPRALNHAGNFR